jgi:hypothetical protein
MGDGDSVAKHLNAFNNIVTQLISFGVKKDEEDHCMTLLCSLPDSWDLVMTIGSIVKNLVLDEVVPTLLSKEVRQKALESTNEALVVLEKSKEKG